MPVVAERNSPRVVVVVLVVVVAVVAVVLDARSLPSLQPSLILVYASLFASCSFVSHCFACSCVVVLLSFCTLIGSRSHVSACSVSSDFALLSSHIEPGSNRQTNLRLLTHYLTPMQSFTTNTCALPNKYLENRGNGRAGWMHLGADQRRYVC